MQHHYRRRTQLAAPAATRWTTAVKLSHSNSNQQQRGKGFYYKNHSQYRLSVCSSIGSTGITSSKSANPLISRKAPHPTQPGRLSIRQKCCSCSATWTDNNAERSLLSGRHHQQTVAVESGAVEAARPPATIFPLFEVLEAATKVFQRRLAKASFVDNKSGFQLLLAFCGSISCSRCISKHYSIGAATSLAYPCPLGTNSAHSRIRGNSRRM